VFDLKEVIFLVILIVIIGTPLILAILKSKKKKSFNRKMG